MKAKVLRHFDGKIYAVHKTRVIWQDGKCIGHDVLVTEPVDRGQIWLDGTQVTWCDPTAKVDIE